MLSTFVMFWRRGAVKKLLVLGTVSVLSLCACSCTSSTAEQVVATPTTKIARAAGTPTTSPSSHKLSAAQKQHVSDYLNAGLSHYVDAWHKGQKALGTTQYADAWAGLRAMEDPNSAASRFTAWRASSGIEFDYTTYVNAFNSADAVYTAGNEPKALLKYQGDMGTLQADVATWIEDAVGWQIQTTDSVTMTNDVQTIKKDIIHVQSDITATIAAS